MAKRGEGYGSEDHLRNYLQRHRKKFDAAVAAALGAHPKSLAWLDYPKTASGRDREFQGLSFLGTAATPLRQEWRAAWPTTGRQQSWDAIGRLDDAWLLVEAKSNAPEFTSPPTTATPDSLKTIKRTLNRVKRDLGVHRFVPWTGTYYQYANRLAMLWFLRKHDVEARLVLIYFYGDKFPDATPCPRTPREWEPLFDARRLTLGLPKRHALSKYEHHVFLPALKRDPSLRHGSANAPEVRRI